MRDVFRLVEKVARTHATVLISGENGAGKEVVAKALHHCSLRCERPWVDINCGALPNHLMESELLAEADRCMYKAKQMSRKRRVVLFPQVAVETAATA